MIKDVLKLVGGTLVGIFAFIGVEDFIRMLGAA